MDYKTEAAEYQASKRRIAEARSVRRRKRRNARKQQREALRWNAAGIVDGMQLGMGIIYDLPPGEHYAKDPIHEQFFPPARPQTQSSSPPGEEVADTPAQG